MILKTRVSFITHFSLTLTMWLGLKFQTSLTFASKPVQRLTKIKRVLRDWHQRPREEDDHTALVEQLEEPIVDIPFVEPQILSDVTHEMSHGEVRLGPVGSGWVK
jgi:hypothetical protein